MLKRPLPPSASRDRSTYQGVFLGLLCVVLLSFIVVYRDALNFATWQNLKHTLFPCKSPITYSLGTIDNRFGITSAQFLSAVSQAEQLWETAVGKNLFEQKPDGELTLNLIYDYRQAGTVTLQDLGLNIQTNNASYEALKSQYDDTYATYLSQKTELDALLKEHEARAAAYTAAVDRANASGGAKPHEAQNLEAERNGLNAETDTINAKVAAINTTADTVNALAGALNDLAEKLNLTADKYNTIGNTLGDEFVEGTFGASSHGDVINIYQFEDEDKLVRVLAHELGHALGLEHVDDPEAIMYRLNEGENGTLTDTDINALKHLCRMD